MNEKLLESFGRDIKEMHLRNRIGKEMEKLSKKIIIMVIIAIFTASFIGSILTEIICHYIF